MMSGTGTESATGLTGRQWSLRRPGSTRTLKRSSDRWAPKACQPTAGVSARARTLGDRRSLPP